MRLLLPLGCSALINDPGPDGGRGGGQTIPVTLPKFREHRRQSEKGKGARVSLDANANTRQVAERRPRFSERERRENKVHAGGGR